MRMIAACEFSGRVRNAFANKGWDAWSCDLIESETEGNHIIANNDLHLKDILYGQQWDLVIGFPPCTRLANSVWWYILRNNLQNETYQAAKFFNMILNCPAKKVCLENPIQNKEARKYIRKYDQIIQPYNFRENASKQTCLWLKKLPQLLETGYFPPRLVNGKRKWGNQTDGGWNKVAPGPERWKERSRTYFGVAEAMAEQWTSK
jgi:hypothetical protein